MKHNTAFLLTALAPAIWGSTYLVTTEFLPADLPLTIALLRALPAGILLLIIVRSFPTGTIWLKVFILGALNFSIFWYLLFVSAYRLPGGVAAMIGAFQPLIVIFLAHKLLKTSIQLNVVAAAIFGVGGVGLLILSPQASLDPLGVIAALFGALSMAAGTVLSRQWLTHVPPLTCTAWQLTAGGLLLLPAALCFEAPLPELTKSNMVGFVYLSLVGAAFTYFLWFQGVTQLEPSIVAVLGFLSPVTAILLGWWVLNQSLSFGQWLGTLIVLGSVWLSRHKNEGREEASFLMDPSGKPLHPQ